jgi:hypothetical protein
MPWCPKCKCEYRKEFAKCSDCGCELVDVLEADENQTTHEVQGNEEMGENDTEALLVSVRNDIEAKIIESKLNAFGVPSVKQFRGLDGIYGLTTFSGVDIYVSSSLLETARNIINN